MSFQVHLTQKYFEAISETAAEAVDAVRQMATTG